MRCKRYKLAGHEAVATLVYASVQSRSVEQRGQVEGCKCIENDNFVSGIGVNGLGEREVRRCVVEGLVECRHCSRVALSESTNELLQVTFALSSSDRRAGPVVVVERLERLSHRVQAKDREVAYQIEIILVVLEVLLGEKWAERGIAERVSLVRAELKHSDDVGRRESQITRELHLSH